MWNLAKQLGFTEEEAVIENIGEMEEKDKNCN